MNTINSRSPARTEISEFSNLLNPRLGYAYSIIFEENEGLRITPNYSLANFLWNLDKAVKNNSNLEVFVRKIFKNNTYTTEDKKWLAGVYLERKATITDRVFSICFSVFGYISGNKQLQEISHENEKLAKEISSARDQT